MKKTPGVDTDSLIILVTALAARLALLLEYSPSPLFGHPPVDGAWHHLWAGMVSSGDVMAFAPFFRAPLYPWLLGALYSVTGVSVAAGALLSLAVSVAGCVMLHRLALKFCPRRAALAASLAWALWAPAVFYSSTLLIEPLYMTLLIAAMLLMEKGRFSSSALILGFAAVARPGALVLLPVLLFRSGPRRFSRLLPALAPILAVWALNTIAGDPGVVISSQGGINLYLGNGPEADGMTAFAPIPTDGRTVRADNVWSASVLGAPPGESESGVSRFWTRRAVASALGDPVRWASLSARKLLLLFSPVEIPGNYDLYYMRGYSTVLRFLLLPPPACIPFSLLLLLLPAVVFAGRPSDGDRVLFWWSVLLLAGILPFFVTARFRLPAVPFMLILAAGRLSRSRPRIPVLLAGAVLAAGASFASKGLAERAGVNMPFQDALAHEAGGDAEGAEALFLQSLDRSSLRSDLSMNRVEAMHNLGLLAARRGSFEEAEEWWRAALEYNPGFTPSLEALSAMPR